MPRSVKASTFVHLRSMFAPCFAFQGGDVYPDYDIFLDKFYFLSCEIEFKIKFDAHSVCNGVDVLPK